MIEKIILGFLKYKDMTAYDVKKTLERTIHYFYSSSLGSINPALKKMEKQGEVSCNEVIEGGRLKRIYTITEKGERTYGKWLYEPISIGRIKEESLVRLFFMSDVSSDKQKELISDYLDVLKENRLALVEMKEVNSTRDFPREMGQAVAFRLSTVQFGIDYYKFAYDWFRRFLKELDTISDSN